MKHLTLLPLALAVSCTSHPKPQVNVRPLPVSTVGSVEAARYEEVLRAYHLGRFVDANHPLAMHEAHPVYRVEATARWNLHPGPLWPAMTNLLNPPLDAGYSPPPVNDAVIAEVTRQREATDRVIQEARRLAQAHEEFQHILEQMRTVVTNQALFSSRLTWAEQRVADFGKEVQRLSSPPATSATNEVLEVGGSTQAPGE